MVISFFVEHCGFPAFSPFPSMSSPGPIKVSLAVWYTGFISK